MMLMRDTAPHRGTRARSPAGTRGAPISGMSAKKKIKTGFPADEATRSEHGEGVVRPEPNVLEDHDPADTADHGPHVDRVGVVAVDADGESAEPPAKPRQ
jgi:hypothetical protein